MVHPNAKSMNFSRVSGIISRVYYFLSRYDVLAALVFFTFCFLHIWRTSYIPSLDGPQHLYNANVMKQLLKGNDFFREFFRINPVIVGYWSGHLLLSFFKLFLPAGLAQKFFLMSYVLGMYFSFRYLVRSHPSSRQNLMVYLIFPFIFHFYLSLGYYTFSLAVIFYFWAMGYWIRNSDRMNRGGMISFGALAMAVFLSHGLVFLFFGISLFLHFVITHIPSFIREGKKAWSGMWRPLWRLMISVAPAVLLWAIYIMSVMDINSTVSPVAYSFRDLALDIMHIRQLVGFHHEVEAPPLNILFILLAVLGTTALILFAIRHSPNYKGERKKTLDLHTYIWTSIVLVFMAAYFLMPDRISAGSLTHRFGLFFFLSLLVLLAIQPIPKMMQIITMLLLVWITWQARENQRHFMENLTQDITDIRTMAPHMKENSTVLSLNSSGNWIHKHFPLYVAVDKPLVHLNNPQCAGQFPIIWNERRLPECYVGEELYIPGGAPDISGKGHRRQQVDYITVYHQETFWGNEENRYWHLILNTYYRLVMTTPRNLGALYERIN